MSKKLLKKKINLNIYVLIKMVTVISFHNQIIGYLCITSFYFQNTRENSS